MNRLLSKEEVDTALRIRAITRKEAKELRRQLIEEYAEKAPYLADTARLQFLCGRLTSEQWQVLCGFNPVDDDLDTYRWAIDQERKK